MGYPKYYIGPMSKNIVDAILRFCKETKNKIGLIPSRRQVEWDGGYVNNWTTKRFSKYANELFLVRDHAGPGQGYNEDDGFESLGHDCKYFDMIHIDPWKNYPSLEEGIQQTVNMIKFCYKINPDIAFEVGTEEAIRRFTVKEINTLIIELKLHLTHTEFNQVKYVVIQSGTSLKGNTNTGSYNKTRLELMIKAVQSYKLLSKEHNGDYLPNKLIKQKFKLGLKSINIAPEFGQIETKVYLDKIKKERPDLFNIFYLICYNSMRWEKWVNEEFNPEKQKEEIINICGHYILSHKDFIREIKSQLPDIDFDIQEKIKDKLNGLWKNI